MKQEKILIAVLRFHGDVLLTKPMIDCIKLKFPNSLIDLLVYKGTASLLESDPDINTIIEIEPSESLTFFSKLQNEIYLLRSLLRIKYTYGFFLTTQWRLALVGIILFRTKTAAVADKSREGFLWKKSFSEIFPEAGNQHIVARNMNALKALNINSPKSPNLRLRIPKSTEEKIDLLLLDNNISERYSVIHPISRRKSKLWSKQRFNELIRLIENKGFDVILTSGPEREEINYIDDILKFSSTKALNLGGKTSLIELAALINKSDLFVGLDSVASHIAASVGTNCVTLFGPSNHTNWSPWFGNSEIITRQEPEGYCHIHNPLGGKFTKCLCYITPERVIQSIEKLLD